MPVTLKSGDADMTLALGEQQLSAKVRLRTAPRLSKTVFLEAVATRPDGDWVPGNIQLVRDGSTIGATYWNPQAGDKLVLPFGSDRQVSVKYQRDDNRNGNAGIVNQRVLREVADTITVSSSHRQPYPIVVLDSAPVSTDDELKVEKQFAPLPGSDAWDGKRGVVAWEQTLDPKNPLVIKTRYRITYPEDRVATGLP